MKKLFSAIFIFFVFSSCSTSIIHQTGPSIELPFYRQSDYQCGPSALASVINYWNRKAGLPEISLQEIIDSIYSQGARGVLGIDLEIYARKKGFDTIQKSGTVEELKAFINEGIPPIILVSYGFSVYQLDHFMVVKSYNEKGIIVNSKKPDQFISYKELSRIWKRAGYWMLVIKP
jgi:ABC-type bacteriocin/lantibiotic exporter with double-glycine peptidase domain